MRSILVGRVSHLSLRWILEPDPPLSSTPSDESIRGPTCVMNTESLVHGSNSGSGRTTREKLTGRRSSTGQEVERESLEELQVLSASQEDCYIVKVSCARFVDFVEFDENERVTGVTADGCCELLLRELYS